jgi:hypothetical protein
MKIYVCNNSSTYIWNQHIPFGAWYGLDNKSWWFCTAHGKSEDGSLELYRFNGTRWVKAREKSDTTHEIYAWATSKKFWWTKCHWFKEEDKQRSLVAKQITERDNHIRKYESLMAHKGTHKKSGSGIRLDKENFYADKLYTDYECTSRPMHDFQRF